MTFKLNRMSICVITLIMVIFAKITCNYIDEYNFNYEMEKYYYHIRNTPNTRNTEFNKLYNIFSPLIYRGIKK